MVKYLRSWLRICRWHFTSMPKHIPLSNELSSNCVASCVYLLGAVLYIAINNPNLVAVDSTQTHFPKRRNRRTGSPAARPQFAERL